MAKTVPNELRDSVVIMAAVLASYGSALLLEDAAHLHVDIVIQSVALAWTLAWTQRDADLVDRALGFLVLPAVAMAAAWADRLMSDHTAGGDALFAVAVAGSSGSAASDRAPPGRAPSPPCPSSRPWSSRGRSACRPHSATATSCGWDSSG